MQPAAKVMPPPNLRQATPPLTEQTDTALLALIADTRNTARRQTAAAIFVKRHLTYVFRICERVLQNTAEAEEAAQDVFLSVWNKAGSWNGGDKTKTGNAKVTSWLYRIAHNRAIDIIRKRRATTTLDDAPELPDATDIEAAEIEASRHRLITTALETLKPDQRRAIELVYYKEMKQGEAAAQMDISLAALESILRRARKNLSDTLTDCHNESRLI